MKNDQYNILEEKNVIDDHLLDIIGNEFKFDHEKGIAEWLKNSVDAYIRSATPDARQYVILKFKDDEKNNAVIECIDFNGMTSDDIDKALKRWGDPEAARRGTIKKVYGGHGNGGKFYMRQMFNNSHFVTYKNGILNIFGFSKNKKYGFANGFKNKKVDPNKALEIANLSAEDIPKFIWDDIKNGKSGFTVVKGTGPKNMKNKIKATKICEKLKKHPQSMRIMDRISVVVHHNDQILYSLLKPELLKPLIGFEKSHITNLPEKLIGQENEKIIFSNEKYDAGKLTLKTSEIALTANSKYSELNRIDIIGELGVIASYNLRELGLYYPQTDFIFGECECPILEDPLDDCVMNDRNKLADNEKSRSLLNWIKEQVKNLCVEISTQEKRERESLKKKLSSDFNNFLDNWKNSFMSKILGEILVGPGNKMGIGNDFGNSNKSTQTKGGKNKNSEGNEDLGGEKIKKGSKFPRVLLSGHDEDPLNPGSNLELQPTQGLIYQRGQDVKEGIYWINTSSPLAKVVLERYDSDSPRWREYLFQRYVDIFMKEALITLESKEPERFNALTVDGEILGKLVQRIHEEAAKDLGSFLFDEKYEISK